jgi:hypothetical protein
VLIYEDVMEIGTFCSATTFCEPTRKSPESIDSNARHRITRPPSLKAENRSSRRALDGSGIRLGAVRVEDAIAKKWDTDPVRSSSVLPIYLTVAARAS